MRQSYITLNSIKFNVLKFFRIFLQTKNPCFQGFLIVVIHLSEIFVAAPEVASLQVQIFIVSLFQDLFFI